jgi:anti-sigma regulatory factor (Ser/Thr protein kinase)
MTNHQARAGKRHMADEPLSVSRLRPAQDSIGDDATLDWRISFPGVPAIVAVARQLVRATHEDSPRLDDLELVTSELVTNAIAHGAAPVTLALTVRNGQEPAIVIDVTDASPDLPVQHLPGEVGHFGLWIAEELARVTVHPAPPGKTVRATFDVIDTASLPSSTSVYQK